MHLGVSEGLRGLSSVPVLWHSKANQKGLVCCNQKKREHSWWWCGAGLTAKGKGVSILWCWMSSSPNYTVNSYQKQESCVTYVLTRLSRFFYALCYLIEYLLPRQFTAFSFLLSKIDERDTIKTKDPAKGKDREHRIFWNTEYFSCKAFVNVNNKIDTIVRNIRIRDIE